MYSRIIITIIIVIIIIIIVIITVIVITINNEILMDVTNLRGRHVITFIQCITTVSSHISHIL